MSSSQTGFGPETDAAGTDSTSDDLAALDEDDSTESVLDEVVTAADEAISVEADEMQASPINQAPYHVAAAIVVATAQCTANGTCSTNLDPEELEEITDRELDGSPGIEELIESRTDLL